MPWHLQHVGGLNRSPVWVVLSLQILEQFQKLQGVVRHTPPEPDFEGQLALERARHLECSGNLREVAEATPSVRCECPTAHIEEYLDRFQIPIVAGVGSSIISTVFWWLVSSYGQCCRRNRRSRGVVERPAAGRERPGLVRW